MLYKAFQVTVPYFIHRVESHSQNGHILDMINSQNASIRGYQRTDEDDQSDSKYLDAVFPVFVNAVKEMSNELNCTFKIQGNPWFTQYSHNEFCRWHVHEECHWVFVYYLEFPEGSPYTTFRTLDGRQEFEVPVKEGDMIIFPGFMKHCSKINKSNGRKTVITLNTSQWTTEKELMEPIDDISTEEIHNRVFNAERKRG